MNDTNPLKPLAFRIISIVTIATESIQHWSSMQLKYFELHSRTDWAIQKSAQPLKCIVQNAHWKYERMQNIKHQLISSTIYSIRSVLKSLGMGISQFMEKRKHFQHSLGLGNARTW